MKNIIDVRNLIFEYFRRNETGEVENIVEALSDVNLQVEKGAFVSIVGANGSGKSTLAKNLNALLLPTEGTVIVDGRDTRDADKRLEVRKSAGMVFQNPDNQIVGTTVETDVSFGPENLGVESEEIVRRVETVLDLVGLSNKKRISTAKLSGGQKQKLAIAGVLAMRPECMILDEATAMLDAEAREKIMRIVHGLNKEYGMTIIHITHFMEEIFDSDYIYVMKEGKIACEGTPEQILAQPEKIQECHLECPAVSLMAQHFKLKLSMAPYTGVEPLTTEQRMINSLAEEMVRRGIKPGQIPVSAPETSKDIEHALIFDHVSFRYEAKYAQKEEVQYVIQDVSFTIEPGEFVGIAGQTGSGKSTLLQLMNGLLKPVAGTVYYRGRDIWDKDFDRRKLRQRLGLVFQYPEHQLFGETVYQDVVFGPYRMNMSKVEAQKHAFEAIRALGLGEEIYDLSPFALSGGQKRRVAIAGVLAMEPEYLILDEPTAGLDSAGRRELLELLSAIRRERNMAVVMVSHSMEEMAEYTDRMLVMKQGRLCLEGATKKCFQENALLADTGLRKPAAMRLAEAMRTAGMDIQADIVKQSELFSVFGMHSGMAFAEEK